MLNPVNWLCANRLRYVFIHIDNAVLTDERKNSPHVSNLLGCGRVLARHSWMCHLNNGFIGAQEGQVLA